VAVEFLPDHDYRLGAALRHPFLRPSGQVEGCVDAVLGQQRRGLPSDAPYLVNWQLGEKAVQLLTRNDGQAGGFLPLGGDFGHHLGWRQPHGKGKAELAIQVLFDARGHSFVRHPQRPPEAGQVGKTLVDRILFHVRRIAPHNSEEALGEQAVGLGVCVATARKAGKFGEMAWDMPKKGVRGKRIMMKAEYGVTPTRCVQSI